MQEAPSPDWLSWAWVFWAQYHESIRDLVITFAGLVGIPFVIWRELLHYRQTKAALQQVEADWERRITDNYTRAVELLGSSKLETRLGAIYALERIAQESRNDHWSVMETMTAYLREGARWQQPVDTTEKAIWPALPSDIQAACTVVGRRRKDYDPAGYHYLDLTYTDLRFCRLVGAHLEGALLIGAHLENAVIVNAHLERASLRGAHLKRADLTGTRLTGANFEGVHMEGADLINTDLTQEQFDSAISDENTKVPPHINRPGKPAGGQPNLGPEAAATASRGRPP